MRSVLLSCGIELVPAETGGSAFAGDREATEDLVKRLFLDSWDRARIREILAETLAPVALSERTDEEVLDLLTRQIAAGEWALVRHAVDVAPPEIKKEKPKEAARAEKLGWIEIELVDEDDKPVPGERYRIELPDGAVREGTLNMSGFARIQDIESGDCKITFPELDQEVWEPI